MRLTAVVEKKFSVTPNYWSVRSAPQRDFSQKYFAKDNVLTKRAMATQTRMLALVRHAAHIELKFWQGALVSRKITTDGIRAANQRIRYLSRELGLDESVAKEAMRIAKIERCRRKAFEFLERWRNGGVEGYVGHLPPEVRRYLRWGGLSLGDIESSEEELLKLKRGTRRDNVKRYCKHQLSLLRAGAIAGSTDYTATRIQSLMKEYSISAKELKTSEEELNELSYFETSAN